MPILANARHELVAQHMDSGRTFDEACERSAVPKGGMAKLANNLALRDRVTELLEDVRPAEEEINQQWVMNRLRENVERAMQIVEVRGPKGESLGKFVYNGAWANQSLELIGRHLGMFVQKHEVGGAGAFSKMTDDELRKFIAANAPKLLIDHEK